MATPNLTGVPELPLPGTVDWRTFLTELPPGAKGPVKNALERVAQNESPRFSTPELRLFCIGQCQATAYCKGISGGTGAIFPGTEGTFDALLRYFCDECKQVVKTFAVRVFGDPDTLRMFVPEVLKVAEWPIYAPPTPPKVNAMFGPDRDLFFKGRNAESLGLGVGAFAYYRRIVEDQKNRLLDVIIQVASRTNAPAATIALLEKAKGETQFSKAVEMVRDAVPPMLHIKGHNPLTLLHSAISRDLHGATDEACLGNAHAIRVILCELAEKLGQALKDQKELDDALSRLLNQSE